MLYPAPRELKLIVKMLTRINFWYSATAFEAYCKYSFLRHWLSGNPTAALESGVAVKRKKKTKDCQYWAAMTPHY